MATSTETAAAAPPADEPAGRRWSVGRILAVSVTLALILFWIWIFAGGPTKHNPDYLSDRDWVKRAAAQCTATGKQISALPGAETTPDHVVRARVVERATDDLDRMLAKLAADPPKGSGDARLVDKWLADYRTYAAARHDYAARLSKDLHARLLLTEKFRFPIDDVIGTFADVNGMPSCEVPGDVI